jgi:hypothetical protein
MNGREWFHKAKLSHPSGKIQNPKVLPFGVDTASFAPPSKLTATKETRTSLTPSRTLYTRRRQGNLKKTLIFVHVGTPCLFACPSTKSELLGDYHHSFSNTASVLTETVQQMQNHIHFCAAYGERVIVYVTPARGGILGLNSARMARSSRKRS